MSPTRSEVLEAWNLTLDLIGGESFPGYMNHPALLQAEEREEVSVPDAVLGHVLSIPRSPERAAKTLEVAEALASALLEDEVRSQCHGLHAILCMMLDRLGIPSVFTWGTLRGEKHPEMFILSPYEPSGEGMRPGHSWLVTPDFWAIDIALRFQAIEPGSLYEELQTDLPPVVALTERFDGPAPRAVVSFPYDPLPYQLYQDVVRYGEVLGWCQTEVAGASLMYSPSALTLPAVDDTLSAAQPLIGGRSAEEFFASHQDVFEGR